MALERLGATEAEMVRKSLVFRADSWLSCCFPETDLEDEGCGEVHCEREEQREYHHLEKYISISLLVLLV